MQTFNHVAPIDDPDPIITKPRLPKNPVKKPPSTTNPPGKTLPNLRKAVLHSVAPTTHNPTTASVLLENRMPPRPGFSLPASMFSDVWVAGTPNVPGPFFNDPNTLEGGTWVLVDTSTKSVVQILQGASDSMPTSAAYLVQTHVHTGGQDVNGNPMPEQIDLTTHTTGTLPVPKNAQNPNPNAAPTLQSAVPPPTYPLVKSGTYDAQIQFSLSQPGNAAQWCKEVRLYTVGAGTTFSLQQAISKGDLPFRIDGVYKAIVGSNTAGQQFDIYAAYVDGAGVASTPVFLLTTAANPLATGANAMPSNQAAPSVTSISAGTATNAGGTAYDQPLTFSISDNIGLVGKTNWCVELEMVVSDPNANNWTGAESVPLQQVNPYTVIYPSIPAGLSKDIGLRYVDQVGGRSPVVKLMTTSADALKIGVGNLLGGTGGDPNAPIIDGNFYLLHGIMSSVTQDRIRIDSNGDAVVMCDNLQGTLPYGNFGVNFTTTILDQPNAIDGTYLSTGGIYSRNIQSSQVMGTQLSTIRYDTTLKNTVNNSFNYTTNYDALVKNDGAAFFLGCYDYAGTGKWRNTVTNTDIATSTISGYLYGTGTNTTYNSETGTANPGQGVYRQMPDNLGYIYFRTTADRNYADMGGTWLSSPTQASTVEAVVYLDSRSQNGPLFTLSDTGATYMYAVLAIDSNGVLYGRHQGTAGADTINSGSTVVPLGRWVHLAFTFDPNAGKSLYIDGKLVASSTDTSAIAAYTGTNPMVWKNFAETSFSGAMPTTINSGTFNVDSSWYQTSASVQRIAAYQSALTALQISTHASALKTFVYDTGSASDSGTANPQTDSLYIGKLDTFTFLFRHSKFLSGSFGKDDLWFTGGSVGQGSPVKSSANVSGSSQPSITHTTTSNTTAQEVNGGTTAVSSSPSITKTQNTQTYHNQQYNVAGNNSSTASVTSSSSSTQQSAAGTSATWTVGYTHTMRIKNPDTGVYENVTYYTPWADSATVFNTIGTPNTSVAASSSNPLQFTTAFSSFSVSDGDTQNGVYSDTMSWTVILLAPNGTQVGSWGVTANGTITYNGGNANDAAGTYTWQAKPNPGGTYTSGLGGMTASSSSSSSETYWAGSTTYTGNDGSWTMMCQTDGSALAPTSSAVQQQFVVSSASGSSQSYGAAQVDVVLTRPDGSWAQTWNGVTGGTLSYYSASETQNGQWHWWMKAQVTSVANNGTGNLTCSCSGTAYWYDSVADAPTYNYTEYNGSTTTITMSASTLAPTSSAQQVALTLANESCPSDANGATAFNVSLYDPNNAVVGQWNNAGNGTLTYSAAGAIAGAYSWKVFAYILTDNHVNAANYTCTVNATVYGYQNVTTQTTTWNNNAGTLTNYTVPSVALAPTSNSRPIALNLSSVTCPSDANGSAILTIQLKDPNGNVIQPTDYSTDGGSTWQSISTQTAGTTTPIIVRYYGTSALSGSYTWSVWGKINSDTQTADSTYACSWSGTSSWYQAGPSGGNTYVLASDGLTQRTATSDSDITYVQQAPDMVSVRVSSNASQALNFSLGFDVQGI